jgi:Tfp pilus assembly protein PilF
MSHASSDASGLIRIQIDAQLWVPTVIEVTAHGYQSQSCILDRARMRETTVVLRARDSGTAREGKTVSAAELPESRQKDADRFNRQGIEALRGGDYAGAESLFLRAISLAPSTPAFYNNIGVTLVRKGEVDRSSDWFEKARQLQPYDPFALGNLGLLRWVQNRHAESMLLLDRAVVSGFQNPSAHYILGILALENGDWRRAERELSITPSDRFPYKHLFRSVALARLGRSREAAKDVSQFRMRNPVPYSVVQMH